MLKGGRLVNIQGKGNQKSHSIAVGIQGSRERELERRQTSHLLLNPLEGQSPGRRHTLSSSIEEE